MNSGNADNTTSWAPVEAAAGCEHGIWRRHSSSSASASSRRTSTAAVGSTEESQESGF